MNIIIVTMTALLPLVNEDPVNEYPFGLLERQTTWDEKRRGLPALQFLVKSMTKRQKKRQKNIQQLVFAGRHRPNY